MRKLIVIGGGGHGREVVSIVEAVNARAPQYDLVGVVDDSGDQRGLLRARALTVLTMNDLPHHDADYVPAVGDPAVRERVAGVATGAGRSPADVVHPDALLGDDLTCGPGLVAFPRVFVSTNVRLGSHVHLNVASTVSHDCVLGDYVTLSPGCHVSGNVTIEASVTLGVGAVVKQGIRIGRGTFVGAGAVVVQDLPPGVTAVGVPAKPIDRR